jgi:putative Holliday junction resolvase
MVVSVFNFDARAGQPGPLPGSFHKNYTGPVEGREQEKQGEPVLGRILALDLGSRTIGLAVSDPMGITAQGLDTIRRRNRRADLAALESVISGYGVAELVVGLPLRMSGAEGRQAEHCREFAALLEKRFGLPVHLWDERLSSVEANRVLRESEISIRKRAAAVDRLAAVLILQNWLEARRSRLEPGPATAAEDAD